MTRHATTALQDAPTHKLSIAGETTHLRKAWIWSPALTGRSPPSCWSQPQPYLELPRREEQPPPSFGHQPPHRLSLQQGTSPDTHMVFLCADALSPSWARTEHLLALWVPRQNRRTRASESQLLRGQMQDKGQAPRVTCTRPSPSRGHHNHRSDDGTRKA